MIVISGQKDTWTSDCCKGVFINYENGARAKSGEGEKKRDAFWGGAKKNATNFKGGARKKLTIFKGGARKKIFFFICILYVTYSGQYSQI